MLCLRRWLQCPTHLSSWCHTWNTLWPISIVNRPPKRQLANVGNGWAHMLVAVVCVLLEFMLPLGLGPGSCVPWYIENWKAAATLELQKTGAAEESTVAHVMCETCRGHAGPRESCLTCYNQNEDHEGKPGKETTEEHLCFFSGAATPAFLCTRGLFVFFLEVFRMILNFNHNNVQQNIIETNCCNTNR